MLSALSRTAIATRVALRPVASASVRAVSQTAASRAQEMHPKKHSDDYLLFHPVYTEEELNVSVTHREPTTVSDKLALGVMRALRTVFDKATGYGHDMDEKRYLQRFLFLETVAGVPGMVAGMLRHMKSLRSLQHDRGWIHTLLEEAENERMHLLTFMKMREPGLVFRTLVLVGQGVFFNAYMLSYLLSPKTCHRFVGFLEEEAVKTYSRCLEDLEAGRLPAWKDKEAPEIARRYWMLPDDAKMLDLIRAVRADEACHRHVNHTLADLKPNDPNPFGPGSTKHD